MPDHPHTDQPRPAGPHAEPIRPTISRRRLVAGAAAVGTAAVWSASSAAAFQDATPLATPLATPQPSPRTFPVQPIAAGGGKPRLAGENIDAIAGAGEPAPDGLELVAALDGPLLVGVTVSAKGRVFLNWPRWGDPVAFTVGELKDGDVVAYPNADINVFDPRRALDTFVSVQAIQIDAKDRLWVLDTGSSNFQPVFPGSAKLVAIDLTTDKVVQTIPFPPDVVLRTSSINDVRFDLSRGKAGMAFITDASQLGTNAIIAVDLASGKSWRTLDQHPSTVAVPDFVPTVEGEELMERMPGMQPRPITLGADGLAIAADGSRLYYSPLASRQLYSVDVDPIASRASDDDVAATVQDLGDKGSGSDGLESDAEGRVYLTQYERNAIARRGDDGTIEEVVSDPRMLWPDTMSLAADGHLYFTANQLHRQPRYHNGADLRQPPYALFRFPIDAKPVRLS